jgi:xanthine dehydrogenase accessory factor
VSGVYETVRNWLAAGHRVAIAQVVRAKGSTPFCEGAVMAIDDLGEVAGSLTSGCADGAIAGWALNVLADRVPREYAILSEDDSLSGVELLCGGRLDVRIEEISACDAERFRSIECTPIRLFIAGANEYARGLCELVDVLGLTAVVLDPRPAFARQGAFGKATVHCLWPDAFLRDAPLTADDAVLVLTHDVRYDVTALRRALASPAFYVGALGSRRTQAQREARLLKDGITREDLRRLRAPIGLDLGGRSSHETALSILAEVISVRNGRTACPLQSTQGPIHGSTARSAQQSASLAPRTLQGRPHLESP